MTTIYLIRHGLSVGNVHHIVSGHINIGLTLKGLRQAELVGEYFADKSIDKIYSSDLNRAKNTVRPTAERLGLEIDLRPELREIDLGDWEGMLYPELRELCPKELDSWFNDRSSNARVPGGESIGELYDRISAAILKIAEENDGGSVVIASHAIAIKAFLCYALGYGKDGYHKLTEPVTVPVSNAGISIFNFENGKFTPVEINMISHLGEEA